MFQLEKYNIPTQVIYGVGIASIAQAINSSIVQNGVVDYRGAIIVVAPVVEEHLKATGTIISALSLSIFETVFSYPDYILDRLVMVTPLHIFWYIIGKRYGTVWAILFHMVWNILTVEYLDGFLYAMYMVFTSITVIYILLGDKNENY